MIARIVQRRSLRYDDGADASLDRPAHVRSASAVRFYDGKLFIAQDDAHFIAVVDAATFATTSIPLPAVDGRRQLGPDTGMKKRKLDLECMEVFDGVVVALGSGSLPNRERAVVLRDAGDVVVVDVAPLFALIRAALPPCELNLEGMCRAGSRVKLFQRGNGAGCVDAVVGVDADAFRAFVVEGAPDPPAVLSVERHELGVVEGVRLTFTDACARADGAVVVCAAAEASPNAVDDGTVFGCALGVLGRTLGPILDESGARYTGKPEGLALDPRDPSRAWIVVDPDDPAMPALLLTLALGAPLE
jgi:hypothetical protein